MKTVSFQGIQLTAGQKRRQAFQQQAKSAFLNSTLTQMVDDACAAADKFRAEGSTWENPNKYTLDYQTKGTPWLGDVFGY